MPDLPEATPARARRVGVALGLLALFAALRVLAARHHAVALTEPEEILNLRLARQLLAGLPLGPMGDYWYTGVGGPGGAGTFVLSLLYVPLVALFGPGIGTVRLMGLLWALAGALLVAALSGRLFGERGRAAGLFAAVAMPPAWIGFTVMARANYVEAAVLVLAAAWAVLRADEAESTPRGAAWATLTGALLPFSAWFWPSAGPPAALLGLAALVALARRPALLGALLGGVLLGSLPALSGFGPTSAVRSEVGWDETRASLLQVLGTPSLWPAILHGSLAGQPVLGVPNVPAVDWAPEGMRGGASGIRGQSWLLTAALLAAAFLPRRRLPWSWTPARRGVAAALAASALAVPPLLGAMGVGPEYLPVRSLYFFDPRRAAIVYPVWALGTAGLLALLWDLPGRLRLPARLFAAAFVLGGVVVGFTFALAGPPAPRPFHPERYLVCPDVEPRREVSVCIGTLRNEDVPVLEAITADPALPPDERTALLQGFAAVEREGMSCSLPPGTVPSEGPPEQARERLRAWEGVGLAAARACLPSELEAVCASAGAPEPAAACLAAARR